jgi:hypothetical protein
MSHQAVSADIIPNSYVGTFSPKTEGTKIKAARVLISWLPRKFRILKKFWSLQNYCLLLATPQKTESEVAE